MGTRINEGDIMPTKARKTLRTLSKFFFRFEPWALFGSYLCIAFAAYFSWVHPLSATKLVDPINGIIEAILLSGGAVLCLLGHLWKKTILELLGLVATIGGLYVFNAMMITFVQSGVEAASQIIFIAFIGMGMMFSRAFRLQSEVADNYLKLPQAKLREIYHN